jgi:hypothetical protein
MIELTNHYTKIQRPTLFQSVPMRGNPAFTSLSMKHNLKKDVFFAGKSYGSDNYTDEEVNEVRRHLHETDEETWKSKMTEEYKAKTPWLKRSTSDYLTRMAKLRVHMLQEEQDARLAETERRNKEVLKSLDIEEQKQKLRDQLKSGFSDLIESEQRGKQVRIPNCIMLEGPGEESSRELIKWLGDNADCKFVEITHKDDMLEQMEKAEEHFQTTKQRTLIHIKGFDQLINPQISPNDMIAVCKDLMQCSSDDYHSTLIFTTKDSSKLDNAAMGEQRIELHIKNPLMTEEDKRLRQEAQELERAELKRKEEETRAELERKAEETKRLKQEEHRLYCLEMDRQIGAVKKHEADETDRILDYIKLPGLPDDFHSDFNTVNRLIHYFVRDKRIIPTLELKPSFTREDVEKASRELWPVIERRFSFNRTIYDIMSRSCNNLRERGSLLRMSLSGHLTPSLTGKSIDLNLGGFGHNREILWVDSGSAETIEKVLERIGDIKKFYLFGDIKKIQCPSSTENDPELEKLGFKRLDSVTKEHKAIYERQL